METSLKMTTTTTVLDRSAGITDPCQVVDDDNARPGPEVPQRARRRTFTAKYKLQMIEAYDTFEHAAKEKALKVILEN